MSDINPCCFQRMNSLGNKDMRKGAATARGNQNRPQTPDEGVNMQVNPTGLSDADVGASLAQIA